MGWPIGVQNGGQLNTYFCILPPLKPIVMSINLCLDLGNTNIKAAIFQESTIVKNIVLNKEKLLSEVKSILDQYHPENAILCSVIGIDNTLVGMLQQNTKKCVVLDGHTAVPIHNAYTSPETLGADRLALVTAAHILYPSKTNLIVSLGTCITYNLINKTKTFRGGAIAPGLHMRLKAMHEFTNQLPMVDLEEDALLLGYDTASCMRSGAVYGMAAEIDGMIQAYEAQYTDFNAILTGGDASYFADKLKSKIFADPDLLIKGLNIILNHNVSYAR